MAKTKTPAQLDAEIKAAFNGAKNGILARRKTADDKVVLLHDDGTLTWALGNAIKGSPNARTAEQIEEALTAGWIVMGEVEIHDADEVSHLIEVARAAARRGGDATLPGNVRKAIWKDAPLKPHWVTLEADRDGRPLVRVWNLPRLSHPGVAIWDEARGSGGRGRYQVMRQHDRNRGRDTFVPTGIQFSDLAALSKYLRETSAT